MNDYIITNFSPKSNTTEEWLLLAEEVSDCLTAISKNPSHKSPMNKFDVPHE